MKYFKRTILVFFLLLALIYVSNITSIPKSIILFQGEKLSLKTILGINIDFKNSDSVQASSNIEESISKETGKIDLSVKLGGINLKDITVNVIPNTVVIPGGESIGLKLYTSGVLVVGMSEIEGEDKNKYKPYQNSGIEEGDMIVKIDQTEITCTTDLMKEVNDSNRGRNKGRICQRR